MPLTVYYLHYNCPGDKGSSKLTEITRKQKEILESMGIKPEHVPVFLKS
jgi:hypothetical protein